MRTSADTINTDNHSEVNEENFKLKPITPEGIFSFACHPGVSCFNKCCHEIDVILTPVDILKMKTALNIRSDEFLKKYTTLQTLKDTGIPLVKLLMRENSKGACIFLDGSKGCSIYQNRPQVCRSYPLGLGTLDPRHEKLQTEGQSPEARFMIQEDMCKGHLEPKTWTLKKWMENQGTVAMEAMDGPQDAAYHIVEEFKKRRDIIVNGLNQIKGINCPMPKGAFYIFPSIEGTGMSSRQFADELLEQGGVASLAGESFGQYGKGCIRFSFANSTENIEKALERIDRFVNSKL